LNSCFLTGVTGLGGVGGFAAAIFGGSGLATEPIFAEGAFMGGATFGGTSFKAGPETFFFTAADISKTFQSA
jgi:hypothetical protein